jgi:hypothetical protein
MTFPVAMPDKTPCALSEDFYQEKLPIIPLLGFSASRRGNIGLVSTVMDASVRRSNGISV